MSGKATVEAIRRGVGRVRRGPATHLGLSTALIGAALLVPGVLAAQEGADSRPGHIWLDAKGHPLPFQGNAEIEDYLRNARVVSREEIGTGINRLDKLLLERDGVDAHAIFRDVDVEMERTRIGERYYMRFRDFYAGECAAYALAQLLRMDNVPPVVLRSLEGQDGSMQIWIESVRDPDSSSFRPPSAMEWVRQTWDMAFFDNLILNVDRNAGNMLVGHHYRLWLIDHTRAFEPQPELFAADGMHIVNRRLWRRLTAVTDEELADATREFLDPEQLSTLLRRRELLVEHVQALIDKLGQGAVLH